MKNSRTIALCLLICTVLMASCQAQSSVSDLPDPPPPKREFRAVWIATVDNIDWPSRKNMEPGEQRQEFAELLDFHRQNGINSVFVQVRAAGDAFYAKSPEPWSEWLTGQQGRAPQPFYDPLEYMIEASHQRGLEFHAWLNLNRLVHKSSTSVSTQNISHTHPSWILTYDGAKLFNFGLPEVRQFITDLTVNIAKNYDIDGIHFDDYFYPYAVRGQTLQDDATFKKYGEGFFNKAEWRRHNIDLLVKQIHDALTEVNPRLKFGISPFGVWRNRSSTPDGSNTYGGLASYDDLFADTRKWIKEGWIDYIAPQVYFSSGFNKVPYKNLVDWWMENRFDRHLYIGQGAYRAGFKDQDKTWANPREIPSQVRYLREQGAEGSIFFSSRSMRANNLGFVDSLRQDFYRYPALIPTMPWKDNTPPLAPQNLKGILHPRGVELLWEAPEPAQDGDRAWYYVIYRFDPDDTPTPRDPRRIVGMCHKGERFLDTTILPGRKYVYYVTAVDRLHNEGRPIGPLRIMMNDKRLEQF